MRECYPGDHLGAVRSLSATGRCVRARTLPLSPRRFFYDAGLSGRSRSSSGRAAPLMRKRFPGDHLGAARSLSATGRCVRARTLPLSPRRFFCDAGLSGISRSSSGRAAPLMRKRFPGTMSARATEGSACPGWREAPAPGRGRRCPAALGDRAVWVEPARSGRVTGPCRVRRCCPTFPTPGKAEKADRPVEELPHSCRNRSRGPSHHTSKRPAHAPDGAWCQPRRTADLRLRASSTAVARRAPAPADVRAR